MLKQHLISLLNRAPCQWLRPHEVEKLVNKLDTQEQEALYRTIKALRDDAEHQAKVRCRHKARAGLRF